MNEHNIFYYPYASFMDAQVPLLKIAALYFDHLYMLDPEKASGGTIGIGEAAQDVALLEQQGILVRVSPEKVLAKFESPIAEAIRADLNDPGFKQLCEQSGRSEKWTLALAKVPKPIRDDPQFHPLDRAMQRFMGELPRALAPDVARYTEVYQEATQSLYTEQFVYNELRGMSGEAIEYRYADYPLPLGEAIMINHALFGGLLYSGATPLTDDSFHSKVLDLKLRLASQLPAIREAMEDRARSHQLKAELVAAATLRDSQLKLPVLDAKLPLEKILEYRHDHDSELQRARDKLGWMARRIEAEPWSDEFAKELEHKTIPDIAGELDKVRQARDAWLKSERGKSVLKGIGVVVGTATAVLALITAPLTPVALATAGLGMVSATAIPGTELLLDWRKGNKTAQENGLHYLLMA